MKQKIRLVLMCFFVLGSLFGQPAYSDWDGFGYFDSDSEDRDDEMDYPDEDDGNRWRYEYPDAYDDDDVDNADVIDWRYVQAHVQEIVGDYHERGDGTMGGSWLR